MATPLQEALARSTPGFDSVLGVIQEQTSRIERNRALAQELATNKNLALFQSDLQYQDTLRTLQAQSVQEMGMRTAIDEQITQPAEDRALQDRKEILDYQAQQEKDLFKYELDNTPAEAAEPLLEPKQVADLINAEKNRFTTVAPKATEVLGLPIFNMRFDENNTPRVLAGDNFSENTLKKYSNINRFMEHQEQVNRKMNEGDVSFDELSEGSDLEGGVKFLGRSTAQEVLNIIPEQALRDEDTYKKMLEINERFGMGNIQLNTAKREASQREIKLREDVKGAYNVLYKYSTPKLQQRLFGLRSPEIVDRNIGQVISQMQEQAEDEEAPASIKNDFEQLINLRNSYGKLNPSLKPQDVDKLYLNPDADEVSNDLSRMLITYEEYKKKNEGQSVQQNDLEQQQNYTVEYYQSILRD